MLCPHFNASITSAVVFLQVHDEVPVAMLSGSLAAGNPAALLLDVQLRKHQCEWLHTMAAHRGNA